MVHSDVPVRDLMNRTMLNLAVIDDLHQGHRLDYQYEVYEIIQLVNSFLAALAHPWEEWRQELNLISLEQAENDGWPIRHPDDPRDQNPKNLGDLLRLVRNALAHGHVRFQPDQDNDIGQVHLWNETSDGWRTWGITLTAQELRQFLDCFVTLATTLPSPRQRTVRHVADRPRDSRVRCAQCGQPLRVRPPASDPGN